MDDIYFSRKKHSGEGPQTPGTPDTVPSEPERTPYTDPADRLSFESSAPSYGIKNEEELRKKITESYGNYEPPVPGSESSDIFSVYTSDISSRDTRTSARTPYDIPERTRTPAEFLAEADSDSDDDFDYGNTFSGRNSVSDTDTDSGSHSPDRPKSTVGKKKKGKKGPKVLIAILLIILICLGGVTAYGISILGKLNYDTKTLEPNKYIDSSELMRDDAVKNILFIGCDESNGAAFSRSDTMMLISLDTKHKAIKLTSFLRDSYLYIPAKDYKAKINSACSYGGPQCLIDSLEYNFEVDIEHYVMVDFKMFIHIVNALKGIDVEIEEDEADFLNKTCGNFNGKAKKGMNHLNGLQALDYCRIRKLDSDFYRTQRQRKVISAIIDKAKSASIFNLLGNMDTILKYVETDIPKKELVSLGAGALTSYLKYDIMQERMPYGEHGDSWWYDTNYYGESIISVDVEANEENIKDFIYNRAPEKEKPEEKSE